MKKYIRIFKLISFVSFLLVSFYNKAQNPDDFIMFNENIFPTKTEALKNKLKKMELRFGDNKPFQILYYGNDGQIENIVIFNKKTSNYDTVFHVIRSAEFAFPIEVSRYISSVPSEYKFTLLDETDTIKVKVFMIANNLDVKWSDINVLDSLKREKRRLYFISQTQTITDYKYFETNPNRLLEEKTTRNGFVNFLRYNSSGILKYYVEYFMSDNKHLYDDDPTNDQILGKQTNFISNVAQINDSLILTIVRDHTQGVSEHLKTFVFPNQRAIPEWFPLSFQNLAGQYIVFNDFGKFEHRSFSGNKISKWYYKYTYDEKGLIQRIAKGSFDSVIEYLVDYECY
jgi:hypothetical protein